MNDTQKWQRRPEFKRADIARPNIKYGAYLLRLGVSLYNISPNALPVAPWTPWEASCVYAYISALEEVVKIDRADISQCEYFEEYGCDPGCDICSQCRTFKPYEFKRCQALTKLEVE